MTTSSHLRITTTTDATPAVDAIKDAIRAGNLATSGAVAQEQIRSFYWWDGAVQDDEETRLSFVTSADFDTVADVLAKAHNYDVNGHARHTTMDPGRDTQPDEPACANSMAPLIHQSEKLLSDAQRFFVSRW